MNGQRISILIIDNEEESTSGIVDLLQGNPLVAEIEYAPDTDQAIRKTIRSNPDVIFLDYPSKGNSEKELIELVKTKLPETTLVFTSHAKEYALIAIQNGIFKYLLKPILSEDLNRIITEAHQNKQTHIRSRINQLIEKTPEEMRVKLQTKKGYFMLNPDELIFCKASGFYTELHLTRNRFELSSQYLMKFEEILSHFNFLRVSRSYLINRKFIRKIYRSNNTIVLSCDGKEYEIKAGKSQIKNLIHPENE